MINFHFRCSVLLIATFQSSLSFSIPFFNGSTHVSIILLKASIHLDLPSLYLLTTEFCAIYEVIWFAIFPAWTVTCRYLSVRFD